MPGPEWFAPRPAHLPETSTVPGHTSPHPLPRTTSRSNHRQDAVRDDFQFGVNLGEIPGRLEHVDVPVEGNLASAFRFLVIDPRVGSMRQNFPFELRFLLFADRAALAV